MSEQVEFGEPWEHNGRGDLVDCRGDKLAIGYYGGEADVRHDDRIMVCVNACAGMSDPAAEIARLRAEVAAKNARLERLDAVLDEISSGESHTYSDDPLTNASMHIDYVTALAYSALEPKS